MATHKEKPIKIVDKTRNAEYTTAVTNLFESKRAEIMLEFPPDKPGQGETERARHETAVLTHAARMAINPYNEAALADWQTARQALEALKQHEMAGQPDHKRL